MEFDELNYLSQQITIEVSQKSLDAMKVMYACGGHQLLTFQEFVGRAVEVGLESRLYKDASDEVAARLELLTRGQDPFIPFQQLSSATGMPEMKPMKRTHLFGKRWKPWQSVWYRERSFPWYSVPPRWSRK
jgi:hypothetical protein